MIPRATWYSSGAGTAVAGPGAIGLIDAAPGGPAGGGAERGEGVQAVVDAVVAGAGFGEVVDRLMAFGLRDLPGFALAFFEGGDGFRLLIRGAVVASTGTSGSGGCYDSAGATTWRELVVPSTGGVTLRLASAPAHDRRRFALVTGSAPAAAVEHRAAAALVEHGAGAGVDGGVAPGHGTGPADALDGPAGGATVAPAATEVAPDAGSRVLPVAGPAPGPAPPTEADGDDFDFGHLLEGTRFNSVEDGAVRPDDDALPGAAWRPPSGAGGECDADGIDGAGAAGATGWAGEGAKTGAAHDGALSRPTENFDSTAGRPAPGGARAARDLAPAGTSHPPPPLGPSRPGLISAVPGMPAPGISTPPAPPGDRSLDRPGAEPAAPIGPPPRPVIGSAAPGAPGVPPPPPPPPPPPAPTGSPPGSPWTVPPPPPPPPPPLRPSDGGATDDDRTTIDVVALDAARAATGADDRPEHAARPLTQAVHCPDGHPNPPYGDPCRRCGAPIRTRTVTTVPRPDLGHLRLDDGSTVPLDQPLIIGRRPPEDAMVGGEPARGVRLPDPDMVLSRTHVEVRLVDWQVQIVDRDSMNHTFVQVPGHAPMQLRPAEPFPIPPGTVVSLGDAVRLTYDVER